LIASGTPDEVLNSDVLRELYGADMIVVKENGMLLIGDVPSAFQDEHERGTHPEGTKAAHFGEEPPDHDHEGDSTADHSHDNSVAPAVEKGAP
jgi:hypothetical protein